jgi:hypothetical protein
VMPIIILIVCFIKLLARRSYRSWRMDNAQAPRIKQMIALTNPVKVAFSIFQSLSCTHYWPLYQNIRNDG